MAAPTSLTFLYQEFKSLNSGAQAISVIDLWRGPTPRHALMEPIVVPLMLTLYLGLKPHFSLLCRKLGTNGKSTPFKLLALTHNILLCSYSVWTAINVWDLTSSFLATRDVQALYCTGELWQSGLQYWGFLFYLSKYWELVDTALLIVKGRSPSYLQVYHHSVTIVCAYTLQASQSSVMFLFVGLNATVHSVMYAYYALTVLGIRIGAKSFITVMQISQFIVGTVFAMPIFFMQNGYCAVQSQKVAVAAIIIHALYLTKLFTQFYRESYQPKAKTM